MRLRHGLGSLAAAAAVVAGTPAAAASAAEVATFSIAAGPLDTALLRFAEQSRLQLLYSAPLVAGRASPGVQGRLEGATALDRLLSGTGLIWVETRPGVLVLRAPPREAVAPTPESVAEVAEVVVTGTLFRGADAPAAPLTVLTRRSLDEAGRATVAEALAALPQVYGGSSTPGSLLAGADPLGTNSAAASGVNLRGLGADATLVLVNGRRLAGTGLRGDFSDLSAIPTAAIERVDILLDGASALYGSDAVGGVVNVILRRDFAGQETRLRASAARGGAEDLMAAHTAGWRWRGGGAVLSYERQDTNGLSASDRTYTSTGDLRPFGGSDRRTIFGTPGNIVGLNAAGDDFISRYAIRPGAGGVARTPADFAAGATNLGNDREGVSLGLDQTRDSVYASLRQDVGRVEFSADLRFSERRFGYDNFAPTALITVTRANPFFVSPEGAASHQIAYGFAQEIGPSRREGEARSLGVTAGLDWSLPADWQLELYGALAEEESGSTLSRQINGTFLNEALGVSADNPNTAYSAGRDGFLNLFGGGGANTSAVLDFISSGYTRRDDETQITSGNLLLTGRILELPSGPLQLALGGQLRSERLGRLTETFLSGVAPRVAAAREYERGVGAVFGELRIPLFGSGNARPGFRRLEISAAARHESYDDAGATTNPRVGVLWEPSAGLRLRSTWGRSFRAPALTELFDRAAIGPVTLADGSAQRLTLLRTGGNPELEPERAVSITAGVDWTPPALESLRLSASVFDIDFTDRIGQPAFENLVNALSDPSLTPFVTRLDPAAPADLATIRALLADPGFSAPGLFPETAYRAVIDGRFVNTASVRVRGVDVSGVYTFDRGPDVFTLEGAASLIADYDVRLTPASSGEDRVGTVGYPAKLRGGLAGLWRRGAVSGRLALDYVDAYRSRAGIEIAAWTTIDAQATWAPSLGAPLAGLAVTLSVLNLLDEAPPFYDSPQGFGFDAGLANPLGRVVALQLVRRW